MSSLGRTVAELSPTEKNAASHRALAAGQMVALMRAAWPLG
ncbi:MAG: non-canonical purine NTP pyrophosphatase [Caldimonas sp.]